MRRLPRQSRTFSMAVLLALGLGVREPAAQQSDNPTQAAGKASGALLKVMGEAPKPLALSAEEFAKLPRKTVKAKGHDGVVSQYEGVSLIDVLAKAGVPTGNDLRSKELTRYIVVEASDGYRAVFCAGGAGLRLHGPRHPPGRSPRRPTALRPRGPASGHRARREETRSMGAPSHPARGRPGLISREDLRGSSAPPGRAARAGTAMRRCDGRFRRGR